MPLYHFTVHNSHLHDDSDGTELSDDGAARQEALRVIRNLKKNNEAKWIGWTTPNPLPHLNQATPPR